MISMSKGYKFKKHQESSSSSDLFLHKHCDVCNRMIPPDQVYCSVDCKSKIETEKKVKKKKNYKTYGIVAFVVIAVIIVIVLLPNWLN